MVSLILRFELPLRVSIVAIVAKSCLRRSLKHAPDYPWMQPYRNASTLERQFDTLTKASGCNNLNCLRQLSITKLRNAADETFIRGYQNGDYGYGDFFFGPYVDGSVIQDLPSTEFKSGRFTKVPLLTNREGYEGYLFTNRSLATTTEMTQTLENLFPYAKQSFFSRLFQLYPRSDFNSTVFQHSAILGDSIIACPSSYFSAALSDYGIPVWKMIFYAGTELHGAIVPFIETVNLAGKTSTYLISSQAPVILLTQRRGFKQRHASIHPSRLLHLFRLNFGPQRHEIYGV